MTPSVRLRAIGTLLLAVAAIAPTPVWAEPPDEPQKGDGVIEAGEDEIGELARAVQNPVANLISLPFQNNLTFDTGPAGASLNVLNIQPVWPFEITDDWTLIRAAGNLSAVTNMSSTPVKTWSRTARRPWLDAAAARSTTLMPWAVIQSWGI